MSLTEEQIHRPIAQNVENVKCNQNQMVVLPVSKAISITGGVVRLKGSNCQSGMLRKYADQVGPARNGAVTQAGGKAEVVCYADI
jgi:hypothetical protein